MSENNKNLKDNELEEVAGGIEKRNQRKNNSCPRCWKTINTYADTMIAGRGYQATYTCDTCQLKWLLRNFYNNDRVEYEMVSFEPVDGAHQYLGNYRDLQKQVVI